MIFLDIKIYKEKIFLVMGENSMSHSIVIDSKSRYPSMIGPA